MLLEFGAKNFFSFKEGFELSLRAGKPSSNNQSFSNIIAIKGANASGKTNVIKVLSFLKLFTTDSFSSLKPDDLISIYSYFDNQEIVSLYAVFLFEGIEYRYELDLTNEKIINETIYKKVKRLTKIFQRDENKITYINQEFEELRSINLNRSNASIISTAKQYGIKKIDIIYNLFNNIISNVHSFGKISNDKLFLDYNKVSERYYKDKVALKFVINFLKKADTGISDISIIETVNKETKKIEYFPLFKHNIDKNEQRLSVYRQSNGVQSLYLQLNLYMTALSLGSVLALDEFDINLHPDILPMLLDLFEDKTINTNNAQLICTTHNYDIMDRLGKYKTVLVNKENNESFLYRLDEIPGDLLRNDRPISPIYNANKIGGKPKIK